MRLLGRVGEYLNLFWIDVMRLMWNSVLCSELAVKMIDSPFIKSSDDKGEWAL